MSTPVVFVLPGSEAFAEAMLSATAWEAGSLETRRFPDGETYLRLVTGVSGREVIVVSSLDRPDDKFLSLAFAASTARSLGAASVGLVAPYLAYMRQDRVFHDGEALTSAQFARLVSTFFDWLVTIDPHLHRIHALSEIYSIPAAAGHAGPWLADWIKANVARPVVIGPDAESEQWVAEVARKVGAPWLVLTKTRSGDRSVEVSLPDLSAYRDHTPVLIDDIVSSGKTMLGAAARLRAAGLPAPACVAVHGLFSDVGIYEELVRISRDVVTTNTVRHASSAIDVAPLAASLATLLLAARKS